MSDTIRVLSVGVKSGTVNLKKFHSGADEYHFLIESTTNAEDGINNLDKKPIDCILSSYELPDGNGIELLKTVRDNYSNLPFILYTDAGSETVASEAINAGVTNYVPAETNNGAELVDFIIEAVVEYRSQLERRRMERRYQAILDDPNLLVGILDTDGRLLEANHTAAGYIDSDIKEMIDKPFWETAWWDEKTEPLVRRKVKQAANGEYVEYEADLTDATGDPYSVTGAIRPVTDETGYVVSLVVSALDITERKIQRRRLQEEQQLVRGILDALPDVFYAFGPNGYLLRWNERLETVTGYSEDEIEDMYVTDFVPNNEVVRIAEHFQTVISEHRSVTIESAFETKDGKSIPYEFTGGPIETAEGGVRGLIGIGRDISDRKQRERRFEAVFNNTYQFTGLMKPDGTLLEANQPALSFSGLDRDDVVNKKIWNAYWFQKSGTARETAKKAVEEARNGNFFREQIEVQGAERDAIIDFSVRPVTDEDENISLLIPEGRDITRLKEREQQLNVTNRVLRHNIRNKLNLIRGTASSLEESDSETAVTQAETIVEAADDLFQTAEMTRELNDLIENKPEPVSIDIVDAVETAVASIQDRYSEATIDIETPEEGAGEAIGTIKTATEELLENAIVHDESDHPEVTISVVNRDSTIEVAVTDNAGGIPKIEKQVLTGDININPLTHGQGLGLWYIYWTVRYSGGSVEISEERTGGSEIRVTLPLTDP